MIGDHRKEFVSAINADSMPAEGSAGEGSAKRYDLIVIGAGPGGIASAELAAKHGKKVALIQNEYDPGSSSLRNYGPVRGKILQDIVEFTEGQYELQDYGT